MAIIKDRWPPNPISKLKKPALILTAEELFELWRSLAVRLYLDELVAHVPRSNITKLKILRRQIAKRLALSRQHQHDFFETYYYHTLQSYNHQVFHELIDESGVEEEELESISAAELIDSICEQYNRGE